MSTQTLRPESSAAAPVAGRRRVTWRTLLAAKGAAFTLPFVIGFIVLFILPIIYAVAQSLYTVKSSGLG
jgi:multiple sugar transport system permease protein